MKEEDFSHHFLFEIYVVYHQNFVLFKHYFIIFIKNVVETKTI